MQQTLSMRLLPFLASLLLASGAHAQVVEKLPCFTCSPTYEAGQPVAFGKTLGQLFAQWLRDRAGTFQFRQDGRIYALHDTDISAHGNLYGWGIGVGNVNMWAGARHISGTSPERWQLSFKRSWITNVDPKINPIAGATGKLLEYYFVEAGANPDMMENQNFAPISHIIAESGDYGVVAFEAFREFLALKERPELYLRMINARNTAGLTTLDYIHHFTRKYKFDRQAHIAYLCANGGVYSYYATTQSCPAR